MNKSNKFMKAAIFACVFLAGLTAQARLGETNVDVAKRYGPVLKRVEISTNEWSGIYSFKEYDVVVVYSNQVSIAEVINPKAKRAIGFDEAKALIESVGGPGKWTTLIGTVWVNDDTKARAQIDFVNDRSVLTVMTRGYFDASVAESKAREKAKLESRVEGF